MNESPPPPMASDAYAASRLRLSIEHPLVVDLDGTLVSTDTLAESVLLFLKTQPSRFWILADWLLRGRAYLKQRLAAEVLPRADLLPYRPELLEFLLAEKKAGREIWLATGANQRIAEAVAAHLSIFSVVFGSDETVNLTGSRKRDRLREQAGEQYAYIGDSKADLPIWMNCAESVLVGPAAKFSERLAAAGRQTHTFSAPSRSRLLELASLLRPHHWLKNILVFAALFLSHRFLELDLSLAAFRAFAALSCLASLLYVVNDLLDLEADRLHARKKNRPLAKGSLPLSWALLGMGGLLSAAIAFAWTLPPLAQVLLACYGVASFTYSLALKRYLFIDAVALAGMFMLRIFIGGGATGIAISEWTFVFALFVFVSLALVKRLGELRGLKPEEGLTQSRRGYLAQDIPVLSSLGAASSYASVIVYFLYVSSPGIHVGYRHPQLLWLVGPILIYWLSRFWILVNRGYLHDDPLVFAFRDRASLLCGILSISLVLAAI